MQDVFDLFWGRPEIEENLIPQENIGSDVTQEQSKPLKPFDFDQWLNSDSKPGVPSKEQIARDEAKYAKIWGTNLFEAPVIERPAPPPPPAETFIKHTPPKVRYGPEQGDPVLFDVRNWYPCYMLTGVKDSEELIAARALKEKPLTFTKNLSAPDYSEFVKLEQTTLEKYCKELVEWTAANAESNSQEWELKEVFLRSLVVYQKYARFLLPAFRNNGLLTTFVDVVRKRIYGLTRSLAEAPESFAACVSKPCFGLERRLMFGAGD